MFKVNKLQKAILYFIDKYPSKKLRGKKKLAKLLYFADFDCFEIYEKPLTGANYIALKMGPYPKELDNVLKMMKKEMKVKNENIGLEKDLTIFEIIDKNTEKLDFSVFSKEELNILDSVFKRYGELTGKDLETITHKEAPYNAVDMGEVIPYELSYYRGNKAEAIMR